jgi:stage II sporulation protein D
MVGSLDDFVVSDISSKKLSFTKGDVKFSYFKKNVCVNNYILSLPIKIEPLNGIIFVNFKPYRGCLILKESGDKVNVINILNIEDYIRGVLPVEVEVSWGIEALKTQAVISRTYAIANLNRHSFQGFDLCSTTHCQVYKGLGVEAHSSNQAILEVQNEILTYVEKPAQTVFHENCGGHTEDPKYVWNWNNTPSYLKGVKCGYCYDAPRAKWNQVLDVDFISKKLEENKIGKIKDIKIKGKTPTGAAKKIEILHSDGKLLLNAYQFRIAIDAQQIKSVTFDSITKLNDDKFYFKGRGCGHKVGLCQWGARGMCEKGKTYKKILSHFYPGTKIETVIYK